MAYYTRPQGLKTNGKPKSLQVTDDGYLKIDMQDTTVVAEFTPGSNVTLLDSAGTNEATIDSSGALKVVEKTPLTGFATAANQRIVANTTEYTQADLVTNVLTIASSKGLYLKNDGTSDFTITIGSLTFTVKPGEVRCIETAAAFTTVNFSAGATFRAFGVTRSA